MSIVNKDIRKLDLRTVLEEFQERNLATSKFIYSYSVM